MYAYIAYQLCEHHCAHKSQGIHIMMIWKTAINFVFVQCISVCPYTKGQRAVLQHIPSLNSLSNTSIVTNVHGTSSTSTLVTWWPSCGERCMRLIGKLQSNSLANTSLEVRIGVQNWRLDHWWCVLCKAPIAKGAHCPLDERTWTEQTEYSVIGMLIQTFALYLFCM